MARFWTQHRLSTHMLKRLAQLSGPRPRDHNHGTPMTALEFREMVRCRHNLAFADELTLEGGCCEITDKGREALAEARREGW